MRAIVVLLALSACTPDIAPGSYLCGAERLCPEGQVCNGPDNTCVLPTQALPFTCDPDQEMPGDGPLSGKMLGVLPCVSPQVQFDGCMNAGNIEDWYQFEVAPGCTAVQIEASVTFPVAFRPLVLQFATGDQPGVPAETPCQSPTGPEDGEARRCFEMTLTPGGRYSLGVLQDGPSCNNTCAFNRYDLRLGLSTP